jgi:hypothetical protein
MRSSARAHQVREKVDFTDIRHRNGEVAIAGRRIEVHLQIDGAVNQPQRLVERFGEVFCIDSLPNRLASLLLTHTKARTELVFATGRLPPGFVGHAATLVSCWRR